MAMNTDHAERDPETAALEAFFAAGRAAETKPGMPFLSAILADAAEIACAREISAPPARVPEPPDGIWRGFAALLGGWRGGAALTACALAGFLIGVSGYARLPAETSSYEVAGETPSDIGAFYDLATLE
jgi:hypothetical protein